MNKVLLVAIALLLAGCANVFIGDHVVDKSFTVSTQRMLVVGAIDGQWNSSAPEIFKKAMSQELSRCGITAEVYAPPGLELNEATKLAALIASLRPDSILNVHQISRSSSRGEVIGGNYIISLVIPAAHREVWKASVSLSDGFFAEQREDGAAKLARNIVQQMIQDGTLRSCPLPTP